MKNLSSTHTDIPLNRGYHCSQNHAYPSENILHTNKSTHVCVCVWTNCTMFVQIALFTQSWKELSMSQIYMYYVLLNSIQHPINGCDIIYLTSPLLLDIQAVWSLCYSKQCIINILVHNVLCREYRRKQHLIPMISFFIPVKVSSFSDFSISSTPRQDIYK